MTNIAYFLLLSVVVSALGQVFLVLKKRPTQKLFFMTRHLSVIQFLCLAGSFLILVYKYAISDFSLLNVATNSHSQLALFYKVAGAWSNHEGSMLLWVFILSLYGVLAGFFTQSSSSAFLTYVLVIQGIIVASFTVFVLFLANPFQLLATPLDEGQGLNPLLHDLSLGFHPPLLYLGYLGSSLIFSFAIAGLWTSKLDRKWAKLLRPWALLSLSFLTLGITIGSWWAYYELGWGGWWFWDPVENASLMPWLVGVALVHALMIQ